jgi:hypothetical protein
MGLLFQSATTSQAVARAQVGGDGQGRQASEPDGSVKQRQDAEQKLAALYRMEPDLPRREVAQPETTARPQSEEQKLADALRWAERYRHQRDVEEHNAARRQAELERQKLASVRVEARDSAQREAAEQVPVTKVAQPPKPTAAQPLEQERTLVEAASKARDTVLAQKVPDAVATTGTIARKCGENCTEVSSRQGVQRVRPAPRARHAQVSPRAAHIVCPSLGWLYAAR